MPILHQGSVSSTNTQQIADVRLTAAPYVVTVSPGAGAAMRVEFSYDDGRTYERWAIGDVTTATSGRVEQGESPILIRVTLLAGSAVSPFFITR